MSRIRIQKTDSVPSDQKRTPEQIADMLFYLTKNLPSTDSFCTKYYKIRPYLGPNFPEAYTDLPEMIRTLIAKRRRCKN